MPTSATELIAGWSRTRSRMKLDEPLLVVGAPDRVENTMAAVSSCGTYQMARAMNRRKCRSENHRTR